MDPGAAGLQLESKRAVFQANCVLDLSNPGSTIHCMVLPVLLSVLAMQQTPNQKDALTQYLAFRRDVVDQRYAGF